MSLSAEIPASTDPLAAMLQDPEVRQSLAVLAANAPTLAALAAMASGLLQRGPELADNVNGLVRQLREESGGGPGIGGVVPLASALASRTEPIANLLDSAVLQPEVVDVIGRLGSAAAAADAATRGRSVSVGGLFAILGQLKDPQVQETLAFLFEFAKVFGAHQAAAGK